LWDVFRRKHLLIGCHRRDPAGYAAAKAVAETLAADLPTSRARVARAPRPGRLASLLATGQLDVAVLDSETAAAMATGRGDFAPYGAVPLGTLYQLGAPHVLLAHARFPGRHVATVAGALAHGRMAGFDQSASPPCPWRIEAALAIFH
ncbi:MAG: hypothetical protein AAF677_17965, partial [Pseudomonadota bacterium]